MQTSPAYKSLDYEFGILIESYRRKAKLTQRELAKMVGISKRAVLNWEAGRSYPHPPHLRRLIAILLELDCFTEQEGQSEAQFLWEKATPAKNEFKDAFDPVWFNGLRKKQPGPGLLHPVPLNIIQDAPRYDWGEAVDNRVLFGREEESEKIEKWIIKGKQRLVGIFGIGGIGKTGLAVSVAHQLASHFNFVIFRSLHNAPPLGELLDSILRFLLNGQLENSPTLQSEKLALLMEYLSSYRCLLILDNLETLMQPGLTAGEFREGYTDYADLIRRISESSHKSCLLVTSRENPRQAAFREVKNGHVHSLALSGLDNKSCQAILHSMHVNSDEEQSEILTRRFGGNPLALKLIAEPIMTIFGGDPGEFLASPVFQYGDGEIRYILDQHFERLSPVEQDILYWLAVTREPLDAEALHKQSLLQYGTQTFVDALSALFKRFLVERSEERANNNSKPKPGITLQGVVIEYVTQRLLNQLHTEIVAQTPKILRLYPLLQTRTPEYVRQSQLRVLIEPLLNQLQTTLKRAETVAHYLKELLENLRKLPQHKQGYAPGNLLNLLIHSGTDLRGWNLSGLALWQTNLVGVELHSVNMLGADLAGATFTEANVSASCLSFSPDGKQLAVGCANGSVKVWQIGRTFGRLLLECQAHSNLVGTIAYSPDGTILASGSMDGTVRLWDLSSGDCLATLENAGSGSQAYIVRSVAFSLDGKWLASAGDDQSIYVWQVSNAQLISKIAAQQGWVMAVAFSPDGKLLASGGFDGTIKLWDISDFQKEKEKVKVKVKVKVREIKPITTLHGHSDWVWTVAFSPDSTLLASGSADCKIHLWSVPQQTLLNTLTGHSGIVTGVTFSPNGKMLLSSGSDRTIILNELENPAISKILPSGNGAVYGLAFHPEGETFVSCSAEVFNIKLWSINNFEVLDILHGYTDLIYSIVTSPDGKWLGIGGIDNNLGLWYLTGAHQPVLLPFLKGHAGFIAILAFSSDSQNIASGSNDSTIKVWNLNNKKCWRTLVGQKKMVTALAFHSDNRLLISGDDEGKLKVWSLITGTSLTNHNAHRARIKKLLVGPNSRTLASASEDGFIKLWEVNSEDFTISQLAGWANQGEPVMSIAFNHDGTLLYSGSSDGIIRCWNVETGECLSQIAAHKGICWSVEYSPTARKLASSGEDGLVQLWNVEHPTRLELQASFRHGVKVMTAIFSQEDSCLFSAGEGGKIKVWNLEDRSLAITLDPPPPYKGLNITGVTNLTEAQHLNLLSLGATENETPT